MSALIKFVSVLLCAAQAYLAWRQYGTVSEGRWCFLLPFSVMSYAALYFIASIAIDVFANKAITQNRLDEKYWRKIKKVFSDYGFSITVTHIILASVGLLEILTAPHDMGDFVGNIIVGTWIGGAWVSLMPLLLTSLWGKEVPGQAKRIKKDTPEEELDLTSNLLFRWLRELRADQATLKHDQDKLIADQAALKTAQEELIKGQKTLEAQKAALLEAQQKLLREQQERARKNRELIDFETALTTRQDNIAGLEQRALDAVNQTAQNRRDELDSIERKLLVQKDELSGKESDLASLEETLREQQAKLQRAQEELASSQQALTTRSEQLDQKDRQLQQREDELQGAQRQLATDQQALDTRAQQLDQVAEQQRDLLAKLDQRQQTLTDAEAALKDAQTQFEPNMQRLANARQELDTKTRALNKREHELAQKEQTLARREERLNTDRDALGKERAPFEAEKRQLAHDKNELERDRQQLATERRELADRQKQVLTQARELETLRQQRQRELADLDQQCTEKRQALESTNQEIANARQGLENEAKIRRAEVEQQLADGEKALETRRQDLESQAATRISEIGDAATSLETAKAKLRSGITLLTNVEATQTSLEELLLAFLIATHQKLDAVVVAFTQDNAEEHQFDTVDAALEHLPVHLNELVTLASEANKIAEASISAAGCPFAEFAKLTKEGKFAEAGEHLLGLEPHIAVAILEHWSANAEHLKLTEIFGDESNWDEKTIELLALTANTFKGTRILSAVSDQTLREKLWAHLTMSVAINLASMIISDVEAGQSEFLREDLQLCLRLSGSEGADYDFGQNPDLAELALSIVALTNVVVTQEHPIATCLRVAPEKEIMEMISRAIMLTYASSVVAYSNIPASDEDDGFDSIASPQLHAYMLCQHLTGLKLSLNTTKLHRGSADMLPIARAALITKLERDDQKAAAIVALVAPNGEQVLPFVTGSSLYRLFMEIWRGNFNDIIPNLISTMRNWDVSNTFLDGVDLHRICMAIPCAFATKIVDDASSSQMKIKGACLDLLGRHHLQFKQGNNRRRSTSGLETTARVVGLALTSPSQLESR